VALSGLRVNLSKSVLIPPGEVPHILDLVEFLSWRVEYPPSSYLGCPLGAPFK